jgi:hypothetical protein
MSSVYLVLALLGVCALGVMVIRAQGKRIKAYRSENAYLLGEIEMAAWKVKKLETAQQKNREVEEAATGDRQELAATPDSGLVDRANGLFGGVRH